MTTHVYPIGTRVRVRGQDALDLGIPIDAREGVVTAHAYSPCVSGATRHLVTLDSGPYGDRTYYFDDELEPA